MKQAKEINQNKEKVIQVHDVSKKIGNKLITDCRISEYSWQTYLGAFLFAILILIHNTLLVDFLVVIFRNEIMFVISYVILTNFISIFIEYIPIGKEVISKMLISEQLLYLQTLNFSASEMIRNVCIGFGIIVIYGIFGYFVFKNSKVV